MNDRIYQAGQRLRQIREEHGLTLRDVEEQSRRIAEEMQLFDYLITAGRLSQVENSNSLPSLYKLATLSFIYKLPLTEMFRIMGLTFQLLKSPFLRRPPSWARTDATPSAFPFLKSLKSVAKAEAANLFPVVCV
jgi:transcriptional regulator with XRE-family HTH domain